MKGPSRTGSLILVALGLILVVVARLELWLPDPHASIANHHLQHLYFVAGGALWGLALGRALGGKAVAAEPGRRDVWLIPVIVAPAAVMFAMWPSTYPYIEARPFLHLIEHMIFVLLAATATYSAYRFSRQLGWVNAVALSAMSWLTVYGFGVTPPPSPLIAAAAAAVAPAGEGVLAQGQVVYDQTCAGCHQAQGTGLPGAFPPLAGHVPTLVSAEGGRDHLVRVVLFGLQGPIVAGGQAYAGVMPPWGQLSDEEVAAVLEYVSQAWDNEVPAGQAAFSASDVAAARAQALTPQAVHDLRQDLQLP